MVDPKVPTSNFEWLVPGKSTVPYDHYSDIVAMMESADSDLNSVIPQDRTIAVKVTASEVGNGSALIAAYAKAKTLGPTETKPVTIILAPAVYDLGSTPLEMDTNNIHLSCAKGAYNKSTSWGGVERASARIKCNDSGEGKGAVFVTADALLIGIDTEISDDPAVFSMVVQTTGKPVFISCSFASNGLKNVLGNIASMYNCHSQRGFETVEKMGGSITRCTSSGNTSFSKATNQVIKDCSFEFEPSGATVITLDRVDFINCKIQGTNVWDISEAGSSETVNTRWTDCKITADSFLASSSPDVNLSQILRCDIELTSRLRLGSGSSLSDSKLYVSGDYAIGITDGLKYIKGNRISTDGMEGVFSDGMSSSVTIMGNTIEVDGGNYGQGIDASVIYQGGNVLTGKYFDTGSDTMEAIDLYISSTGSPTGEGTIGDPVDNIPAAYAKVPYFLKHTVHLHFLTGGSFTWPDVRNEATPQGQLSFDGSNVFDDVDSGPYIVDTWSTGGPSGYEYGELTVTGTPFTPGALAKKFVWGISGTGAGRLIAILSNTNNKIRIAPYYNGLGIGDTFKIVEPGVKITIPAGSGMSVQNSIMPADGASPLAYSRLCLIGLEFVNDVEWWIKDTSAWIAHCKFESSLRAENCQISQNAPFDWVSAVDKVSLRSTDDPSSIAKAGYFRNVNIYEFVFEYAFNRSGHNWFESVAVLSTATHALTLHHEGQTILEYCYLSSPGFTGIWSYAGLKADYVWFDSNVDAIYIKAAQAEIGEIDGNSPTGYVLRMANHGKIALDNIPSFTGVSGSVYFELLSESASFPDQGTTVQDYAGSFVSKSGTTSVGNLPIHVNQLRVKEYTESASISESDFEGTHSADHATVGIDLQLPPITAGMLGKTATLLKGGNAAVAFVAEAGNTIADGSTGGRLQNTTGAPKYDAKIGSVSIRVVNSSEYRIVNSVGGWQTT